MSVDDADLWQQGVSYLTRWHATRSPAESQHIAHLAATCRDVKTTLDTAIQRLGAAALCRECGGLCCHNGKYRMLVLDVLLHLQEQQTLPLADFTCKPLCPYGDRDGCTMTTALRPLDCVLFICDALEDLLDGTERQHMATLEHHLRHECAGGEQVLNIPLTVPLLLFAERLPRSPQKQTDIHREGGGN